MKKFFAFVIAMAMTVAANAALVITTDNETNTIGVADDSAGFVLATAKLVTELDLDWSRAQVPGTYAYMVGVNVPWGGAPTVMDESANYFTAYTSSVLPAGAPQTLFSGIALPEGWVLADSGTAIDLFVEIYQTPTSVSENYLAGTVYAVPEPMTMSLLGLGGLVAARRRRA